MIFIIEGHFELSGLLDEVRILELRQRQEGGDASSGRQAALIYLPVLTGVFDYDTLALYLDRELSGP